MPRYDRTGPEGNGPYGRGFGPCGNGFPRGKRRFFGFGLRKGGGGRGFWPWHWQAGGLETDEKSQLDSEKQWLSQQLDAVNKRLNDLEKKE